jgi:ribose transport system ATP-binding protein
VHAGEIVGIAGLVGSGRSELLETIYGARTPQAGEVTAERRETQAGRVSGAVRAGLALAPEGRKSQALLLDEPIYRNISLSTFARYARSGFTRAGTRRPPPARSPRRWLCAQRGQPTVKTLSGGNQQKVVLARWLVRRESTQLLLLDEPTRGVDVGARAELYQVIRRLADDGLGVLMVSSEVPEVLGLADRVLVMREGRLIHEAPAAELDEETVLDLVMAGSLLEGSPP